MSHVTAGAGRARHAICEPARACGGKKSASQPAGTLGRYGLQTLASWLGFNKSEIYFSIVQRKVLAPNDFLDLAEVEARLLGFQHRYQQTAVPFGWRFTRAELDRLLHRLEEHEQLARPA